ncbi:MAG: YIP1 family protein [Candidatus Zixiibacteriota bacterium]
MEISELSEEIVLAANSKGSSYLRVIWDTIFNPSQAFGALRNKPRWLIPYLISILIVLSSLAFTSNIKMEDIKSDIRSSQNLSQAEIDRRVGNIDAQGTPGVSWPMVRLAILAVTAIQTIKLFGIALVFWLAYHLIKPQISFKQILAVCSFSLLILIPEALIKIPLILAKGTTYIYLGPAVLLPIEWKYSPLFNLLNRLDVFSIWMAVLLIIGFSIALDVSKRKAAITVGYIWGIWLLISMFVGDLVQIG